MYIWQLFERPDLGLSWQEKIEEEDYEEYLLTPEKPISASLLIQALQQAKWVYWKAGLGILSIIYIDADALLQ